MPSKHRAANLADPRALARALAPAAQRLRDGLAQALAAPDCQIAAFARSRQSLLSAAGDDASLADALAQLVTVALLLDHLDPNAPTPALLAAARDILAARHDTFAAPLAELARTIAAVDVATIAAVDAFWLAWYEHFLAAYDPELRRERGAYYTPSEIVSAQLALTEHVLVREFARPLGFASPDVAVLDPACGTGTYPCQLVTRTIARLATFTPAGELADPITHLAESLTAFELMPGPCAVAHVRLADVLRRAGAVLPPAGVRVQLRDTLAAPDPAPSSDSPAEPILVCIGNPPYDRQTIPQDAATPIARRGGWIRHGTPNISPPLADFLPPEDPRAGRHVKNLYNDYVYFWRWALWRVFERSQAPGLICFVTASSFLRGPGFVAMRRHMRALADELWILDLGGDARGPRRSANVFGVATPVCITLALRRGPASDPRVPAPVWYSRLPDDLDRAKKLARLRRLGSLADLDWAPVAGDPGAPFVPRVAGDPAQWPRLDALLPWRHSGAQWKRTWPIAPTPELLVHRWQALLAADDRRALFRESESWTVTRPGSDLRDSAITLPPIAALDRDAPPPPIVPYAWRAFDRQWCLADGRLGDRLRPVLWQIHGDRQIYLTTLMSSGLSHGPAIVACPHVPDLHHFRGSFGDRGVFPLWRDSAAREPNITAGLLDALATRLGRPVSADDLCAYVYGCLANLTYSKLLADALAEPGPRVPITADPALFTRMAALGDRLLRLHLRRDPADLPAGSARLLAPFSEYLYPISFAHRHDQLHVGRATFGPVPPTIWGYEISGFKVVAAWLAARIGRSRARRSSPLDDLRPARWTEDMTRELLDLLSLLEHSLALHAEQDPLLRQIIAGPLIPTSALPRPTPGQDRPPTARA